MKIFFLFLSILFSASSFAQSDLERFYLNKILSQSIKDSRKSELPFYTGGGLLSKKFNSKDKSKKELIEWYQSAIDELFEDTLQQFQGKISKRDVRRSFVKWKKEKVDFDRTNENIDSNFFYISRPIIINKDLFVVIEIFECPLGGTGVALLHYDREKDLIERLRKNGIRRIGLKFRT